MIDARNGFRFSTHICRCSRTFCVTDSGEVCELRRERRQFPGAPIFHATGAGNRERFELESYG
jgi:hypothetical protein